MAKQGREKQMRQAEEKLDELWTIWKLHPNDKRYENTKNVLKMAGARIFLNDKTGEHKIIWDKKKHT